MFRKSLTFASLPIPFRTTFAHASAARARAENVIVCVRDADDRLGLGEGCPRSYVTGETLETARAFLADYRHALEAIESLETLRAWVATNTAAIDANPSAFCAAELALLDLFARRSGQSVEAMLGINKPAKALRVTAVYGASGRLKFAAQTLLFRAMGMNDAKVKVTGDVERDGRRVRRLARRGAVRLDANNLWPDAEEAVSALQVVGAAAWAVEEPVRPRDWKAMGEVMERTDLAIIADESLTRVSDLDAVPEGERFVPNLRVSKLGGLLRSLNVLARARAQGRKVIVGAQVGETSILARAGLALAWAAGEDLVGYEGAYGKRLLRQDAVVPSLGFGLRGAVDVSSFHRQPGWGVIQAPILTDVLRQR